MTHDCLTVFSGLTSVDGGCTAVSSSQRHINSPKADPSRSTPPALRCALLTAHIDAAGGPRRAACIPPQRSSSRCEELRPAEWAAELWA